MSKGRSAALRFGGREAVGSWLLVVLLVDKTGAGLWQTSAALYFTHVEGLSPRSIGLLLGMAGTAGMAGAPLAGWLADHVSLRGLALAGYVYRAGAAVTLLVCHQFWSLLAVMTLGSVGDRAAAVLQRLLVARVGMDDRVRFQAKARVATNIGFALGALGAGAAEAVGTDLAFHVILLTNALFFGTAAVLLRRLRLHAAPCEPGEDAAPPGAKPRYGRGPWRDLSYLAFVLLEAPLFLDASLFNVALPLWLVSATRAPHELTAGLFLLNTVSVIVFQMRLSRLGRSIERTQAAVAATGAAFLLGCCCAAVAGHGGAITAAIALCGAAAAITVAEMLHALTSWELAVSLAPLSSRGAYIGVHGLAQSAERAGGPLLVTGAVLATGPTGWVTLGFCLAVISLVQYFVVRARRRSMDSVVRARSHQPRVKVS
ncbi:MFS transporter [Streptomyces sp. NPDC002076]